MSKGSVGGVATPGSRQGPEVEAPVAGLPSAAVRSTGRPWGREPPCPLPPSPDDEVIGKDFLPTHVSETQPVLVQVWEYGDTLVIPEVVFCPCHSGWSVSPGLLTYYYTHM